MHYQYDHGGTYWGDQSELQGSQGNSRKQFQFAVSLFVFDEIGQSEYVFEAFPTLPTIVFQVQGTIKPIYYKFASDLFWILHFKVHYWENPQKILLPY